MYPDNPNARRTTGHPVVHFSGHGLPVAVAPAGDVHAVNGRVTSAHHVVFQPEEVLAQDERNVHLGSVEAAPQETAPSRGATRTRSPSLVSVKRACAFWCILSRRSWRRFFFFCAASIRASVTGCSLSGSP